MALDPTSYLVGGGAEHSPEVVRQALYDSTGGAEGVSGITDFKVQATQTASSQIRVSAGGALLRNRYAGGQGQSYSVRNISETLQSITSTSSGGSRTDLIVARVLDPQYEGQPPADPKTFQYTRLAVITGVSPTIRSARELNLGYPAVALARVTLPPSTATVQNSHITDLRQLARPRRETVIRAHSFLDVADWNVVLDEATNDGEAFPGWATQTTEIPEWATHVQIRADWLSVMYPPGTGYGQNWVEFGPYLRTNTHTYSTTRFTWDASSNGDPYRTNWTAADEVAIPANIRGTVQPFILKGRVLGGAGLARATNRSGYLLELNFIEKI